MPPFFALPFFALTPIFALGKNIELDDDLGVADNPPGNGAKAF